MNQEKKKKKKSFFLFLGGRGVKNGKKPTQTTPEWLEGYEYQGIGETKNFKKNYTQRGERGKRV